MKKPELRGLMSSTEIGQKVNSLLKSRGTDINNVARELDKATDDNSNSSMSTVRESNADIDRLRKELLKVKRK
jgi:polyhydroxyalkanoate synthesis regulator phasin